jgi:uncharacterized protein YaeQ
VDEYGVELRPATILLVHTGKHIKKDEIELRSVSARGGILASLANIPVYCFEVLQLWNERTQRSMRSYSGLSVVTFPSSLAESSSRFSGRSVELRASSS